MILVRNVFRLRFGKAKEAKELMKEGARIAARVGYGAQRHLMDLTGPFYTLVLESTYDTLASWESAMNDAQRTREWGAWYERFKPLVESGYREIFTVVEE